MPGIIALSAITFGAVFFSDGLPQGFGGALRRTAGELGLMRRNDPQPGAWYRNCDAARAAGVAPLYAGEPGYREAMDGDDDGIACEPYRGR
ncbi:excalibur calcium-binding domain-containing protein [Sphingomonas colocasiae]|uniref:Excalibur calcium-binding domain-containing protein n=1 Tax=Sphingomonas colocasiae TaxID=1848973 RepID=A0ABS7PPS7_9SPHN|nr:excalibur calcium-binding domain-containing protein [Sphingomonas colocasiae]MBY8823201.1 excalibur calcium-binding domain-containing protein [Sphingomonas colocasiae]